MDALSFSLSLVRPGGREEKAQGFWAACLRHSFVQVSSLFVLTTMEDTVPLRNANRITFVSNLVCITKMILYAR